MIKVVQTGNLAGVVRLIKKPRQNRQTGWTKVVDKKTAVQFSNFQTFNGDRSATTIGQQRAVNTIQSDGLGFWYGEGSTGGGGLEGRRYGSERIGRGR